LNKSDTSSGKQSSLPPANSTDTGKKYPQLAITSSSSITGRSSGLGRCVDDLVPGPW